MKRSLKKPKPVIIIALLTIAVVLLATELSVMIFNFKTLTDSETPDTNQSVSLESTDKPFLTDEEMVILESPETYPVTLPIEKVLFEYIEVVDGCGVHFEGECLRVRSGPGTEYPVVSKLRNGMVLKVDGKVERDDMSWYKIVFDEWLRYPERVDGDWYVAADYVEILLDEGDKTIWGPGSTTVATTTDKKIVVDRTHQKLSAYSGDELFLEIPISTGLELTPTPRGTFTIFKKTPSRYMQGPLPGLPGNQYYDLPGVPWNLYFTHEGAVIHGAYWHDSFGSAYSHGCVNLSPDNAHKLYTWAELGTRVVVKD